VLDAVSRWELPPVPPEILAQLDEHGRLYADAGAEYAWRAVEDAGIAPMPAPPDLWLLARATAEARGRLQNPEELAHAGYELWLGEVRQRVAGGDLDLMTDLVSDLGAEAWTHLAKAIEIFQRWRASQPPDKQSRYRPVSLVYLIPWLNRARAALAPPPA
jgi:hypothetical protein